MEKYFSDFIKMSSPYGKRKSPISGLEEFHSGVDLVKKDKEEIYCIVSGKVVFSKFADKGTGVGGYGNAVCVVDSNNHLHLYGHLDKIMAKEGSILEKGDCVGTQGNTGQSAGSHLHYEVRTKVTPSFGWGFHTDPIKYLDTFFKELPAETQTWKEEGLEFLQKEYGISKEWKSTDTVNLGLLGTILRRKK
jgi:murein DD-endopeptidase MepM/ murein hydrolase activator NlpD